MKRAGLPFVVGPADQNLLAIDLHRDLAAMLELELAFGAFDVDLPPVHGDFHAVEQGYRFVSNAGHGREKESGRW